MTAWTVEGVIRCPGCGLYLDIDGSLTELAMLAAAHDCTATVKEETT